MCYLSCSKLKCFAFRLAFSHGFSFYENTNMPFTALSPISQGHFLCPGHVLVPHLWWSPALGQTQLKVIFHCHEEVLERHRRPVQEALQEMLLKWSAKRRQQSETLCSSKEQSKPPQPAKLRYQRNSKQLHLGFLGSTERLMPQNLSSRTRI